MRGFRLFLKRCTCAIQQIMTQIDKFSIVQERTDLIRLLLFSRNKRKGKTIVRWEGVAQQENRYLLPRWQNVLYNAPSKSRRNHWSEKCYIHLRKRGLLLKLSDRVFETFKPGLDPLLTIPSQSFNEFFIDTFIQIRSV